ncbi:MAG: hydrogenase maturation protease [Caldilinea sp. CFX5]|nr:hydrogenase maturation protease [Caldilinea sp. CFX5]
MSEKASLRILITGVGNVLRQDDGFGIAVVHHLLDQGNLPPGVTVMETGIAGIRLVQELLTGYDVLIIVDAVQRDGEPGQLFLLAAEVPDVYALDFDRRCEFLADMHYTNPTRAMMLAKAIHALPAQVVILGCQPAHYDDFDLGLSPVVEAAVPRAVEQIRKLIIDLNQVKQ